ncbi:bifunctional 2',3'-cyclic-nucleotide 2'-phosphodiesterase/3'-nucleotidase [Ruegeria arenilitoris]|uniref:bifunctional 2',3'-cyclic-nucleotide 2'-phosphodiesterase/3'-nucleotidase n=1 Tax=Ruegeria arenilitoris TaxID=1173585 RepID=UPI0020C46AF9|nr:bifunctional 2',3'-cyclic-nucleotide 2'-phosphodiesterase/3'-nucleotidase [Ruegeria arenilitoris]
MKLPLTLPSQSVRLRILATTDLHMNLRSFDYYSDRPEPTIGLTRTASLIRDAREQAEAEGAVVLLFDNGDSLQGTPVGDLAAEQVDRPHPLMQAFKALGYDAVGLGNHDFGFGQRVLDRILLQAPCPVICSNVHQPGATTSWTDHLVLTREVTIDGRKHDLKIGVFSVLPPQTRNWESHRLDEDVRIEDILTCARQSVSTLQSEGCDVIVALAHSGLGPSTPAPDLENAVIPLCAIGGIDAIIAGHTHQTLPGTAHSGQRYVDAERGLVHGIPVVMPGSAGSHLGVIDLELTATAGQVWSVSAHTAELRPVTNAPEDPELTSLFSALHSATRGRAEQPIGQTDVHLHSFFSFCAKDRALAVLADAQASALRRNLVGTDHEGLPVLSAAAPSKFGGRAGPRFYTDIPPGVLRMRHVADLNIFPNELRAVEMSGAQVLDWLEMSAGVFNQINQDAPIELVNADRVGHNFDVLFGLSYAIDLSMPPRFDATGQLVNSDHRRVRDVRFENRPVTENQRFVVALNNYRASGGGHFPFVADAKPLTLPALSIQQVLKDYLTGELPPESLSNGPSPFRFAPVSGTSALLKTSPKAQDHLAEIARFDPKLIGTDADGFLHIQLLL